MPLPGLGQRKKMNNRIGKRKEKEMGKKKEEKIDNLKKIVKIIMSTSVVSYKMTGADWTATSSISDLSRANGLNQKIIKIIRTIVAKLKSFKTELVVL